MEVFAVSLTILREEEKLSVRNSDLHGQDHNVCRLFQMLCSEGLATKQGSALQNMYVHSGFQKVIRHIELVKPNWSKTISGTCLHNPWESITSGSCPTYMPFACRV